MPNINDLMRTSPYVKAHDLQGKEPRVTIARVTFEPIGRTKEMKAVVYFVGSDKGLILNVTNSRKIVEIAGSAITEDWPGTVLTLYVSTADYGGETFDVVRIKTPRAVAARAAAKPAPVPVPAARPAIVDDVEIDLYDGEIPF